jgi:hypothetical protein
MHQHLIHTPSQRRRSEKSPAPGAWLSMWGYFFEVPVAPECPTDMCGTEVLLVWNVTSYLKRLDDHSYFYGDRRDECSKGDTQVRDDKSTAIAVHNTPSSMNKNTRQAAAPKQSEDLTVRQRIRRTCHVRNICSRFDLLQSTLWAGRARRCRPHKHVEAGMSDTVDSTFARFVFVHVSCLWADYVLLHPHTLHGM